MTTLPPVISQVGYPGAGDVDDCWVVASVWAASAADPSIRKPTVPQFRAAAHNPDRPGPTAGDLSQIVHASVALWPKLPVSAYSSVDWLDFAADVRSGCVASLAVLSSALPEDLRFRFLGAHQVGVIWANGSFYLMNPLARNGAAPLAISEQNLRNAARAVDNGWILAALYEPKKEPHMPISLAAAKALIAPGRSSETHEYVQQLFALEAWPSIAKPLVGLWPAEATEARERKLAIAQKVAAIVGSGPYYIAAPLLTCGQVVKAHGWAYRNPSWNLNPTYHAALNRAAKVAKKLNADSPLPWGPHAPVSVVDDGSFGQTPVSGYYGTGDGEVPS